MGIWGWSILIDDEPTGASSMGDGASSFESGSEESHYRPDERR